MARQYQRRRGGLFVLRHVEHGIRWQIPAVRRSAHARVHLYHHVTYVMPGHSSSWDQPHGQIYPKSERVERDGRLTKVLSSSENMMYLVLGRCELVR
jgi:hypothetical protein